MNARRGGALRAAVLAAVAAHGAHAASPALVVPAPGAPLPPAVAAALPAVAAPALQRHVAWLADPARAGRGVGTPGHLAAARYVAAELAAAGVAPLAPAPGATGPEAYFQSVPLLRVSAPGGRVTLAVPGAAPLAWSAGRDAVLPQLPPGALDGPAVFAGYAIREPALGRDDFAGLDVRDRVVVFRSGVPPGAQWQAPELLERYAAPRLQDRYDARLATLWALGARAAVAVEEGLPARIAAGREPPVDYLVPAPGGPGPYGSALPPLARVAPGAPALAALLDGATRAAGATATLTVSGRGAPDASPNVLAVLPGADPRLRGQAVVIGAHLDHLGVELGEVYPGADDNASGVAALLEIARALAASPVRPRRTLVFAFWTGEEAGQYGSQYYALAPAWPLARTRAYVNLDMIAHPWTAAQLRELATAVDPAGAERFLAAVRPGWFAEPGFAAAAPWLGEALAAAGRGTGMALHLDPVDGRDGGSDYRAFARAGLPWIRFFGNYFPDYHRPGDVPAGVDPAQVERMARLVMATAWLLADG